jgi:thioredoxin 1
VTPWLLILGLLLGGGFLAFMARDSIAPAKNVPPSTGNHLVELTAANWQREVVESKVPVLVDFTAKWCGPCIILAPTIERLAEKYQGKIKVGKFDVGDRGFDKLQPLAEKYRHLSLGGVPTVMIFTGGESPAASFKGGESEATLGRALDAVLAER